MVEQNVLIILVSRRPIPAGNKKAGKRDKRHFSMGKTGKRLLFWYL